MPDNQTISLPALYPNQQLIASDPSKYRVVAAGRRFGKSLLCRGEAVYNALVYRFPVWWVVPFYKNALESWAALRLVSDTIPRTSIYKNEFMISYPGGGTVQIISAQNPDNVRGSGLGFVVYDEAAYGPEEMWTDVLLPSLLDYSHLPYGGRAIFISSPNGFNWFYRLYELGLRGQSGYKSFHFTSYDNPKFSEEAVTDLRANMTESKFQREVMAIFSEEALGVFRGWREAVYKGDPPKYNPLHAYVAGVDWGRSNDFTALSIWDLDTRQEVWIDRINQVGFDYQRDWITAHVRAWDCSTIYAERNAIGLAPVEELQKELPVYAVNMTNAIKSNLIQALALAIEQQTCTLTDHDEANKELQMFEQSTTPSGLTKYGAPPGLHDDTVIARALAFSAIAESIGDPVVLEDW